MSDCVFCKIINKELPSNIVYEDDDVLAVMDIFPTTIGQVLVIVKKHEKYVFDLDEVTYTNSMIGNFTSISKELNECSIGDYNDL